MNSIKYFLSGLFLLTLFVGTASAESSAEEEYLFQRKPLDNVSFLVERKTKWIKNRGEKTVIRKQLAIVRYGDSRSKNGAINQKPEVIFLDESGNKDELYVIWYPQKEIWSTGMWRKNWRWRGTVLAHSYDMSPVFPETAVKPGQSWKISGTIFDRKQKTLDDIVFTFDGFEIVDGTRCAKIKYEIDAKRAAGDFSEMLNNDIAKMTKSEQSLVVKGAAFFDQERGIAIHYEHHSQFTHRWTGSPSKKLLKERPKMRKHVDDTTTIDITARLISNEEADKLIRKAEDAKKVTTAKKTEPAEPAGPVWTYLAERKHTTYHDLDKNPDNKTENVKAKARVVFRAEKETGKHDPSNVIYLDTNGKPIEEKSGYFEGYANILEKFTIFETLPEDDPEDTESAQVSPQMIADGFMLPLKPKAELRKGLTWTDTFRMGLWMSEETFPVTATQEVKRFSKKNGRDCAVIDYTIFFEKSRSGDRFRLESGEEVAEASRTQTIEATGVIYYDPKDDIIVEKTQTYLNTTRSERYGQANGKISKSSHARRNKVTIKISLEK